MPDSFALNAVDLTAGYGRTAVLRGVHLTIRTGEFWFFLGTNGQGKSTLLHTLLGILPARGGRVEVGAGHPRSAIGYVPQRCDLAQNLPTTAREFVGLGLVGIPCPRAERTARLAMLGSRSRATRVTTREYASRGSSARSSARSSASRPPARSSLTPASSPRQRMPRPEFAAGGTPLSRAGAPRPRRHPPPPAPPRARPPRARAGRRP